MKTFALLLTMCAAGFAQAPGVKLPPDTKAPAPTVQAPQSSTPSTPASAPDTNAKQARVILDRTIQALGGKAFLTYFDVRQEGRGFGFSNNEPQGVGITYTRLYQYPDKEMYEYFRHGDWVILHVGDKGFETTYRGSREED